MKKRSPLHQQSILGRLPPHNDRPSRYFRQIMRYPVMIRCINLLSLVLLLALANGALAEIAIPLLKSHVTDLTETLSSMEISRLEQQLTDFEAKKAVRSPY